MAELISIADTRRAVGIGQTDTSEDSRLLSILSGIIRQFREEAGWWVGATESVTAIMRGSGTSALSLPIGPVNSVTAVELRYASEIAGGWSAFLDDPANDLILSGRRILTVSGAAFPAGSNNIRATWTIGYSSGASIPANIKEAILERVAEAYRGRVVATPSIQQTAPSQRAPTSSLWQSVVSMYRPVVGF